MDDSVVVWKRMRLAHQESGQKTNETVLKDDARGGLGSVEAGKGRTLWRFRVLVPYPYGGTVRRHNISHTSPMEMAKCRHC